MLDLIGAIAGTAVYAVLVGGLAGLSLLSPLQKWGTYIAAAAWGAAIVTVAVLGGFAPGAAGPVPGVGFAVAGLLTPLLAGWFFVPSFRSALLSLPLAVLVGLNMTRVVGVLFLILAADGRLSAPFAPSAGWGDIITGLVAIPLALAARRDPDAVATPLTVWNVFGTLDLIAALVLGVLSAPGTPFRAFTDEPGTLAIGDLPWIMIPAMLVPLYLLIHLVIATKLQSGQRLNSAAAMAR